MLNIIQNRKVYFIISGLLCLASIVSLAIWGLNFGIDFTGGALMEIEFSQTRLSSQEIRKALTDLDLGNINIQESEGKRVILRMKNIDEVMHQKVLSKLNVASAFRPANSPLSEVSKEQKSVESVTQSVQSLTTSAQSVNDQRNLITESRYESIGPIIGQELKTKTLWAIALTVIAILIYIAWAFRKAAKISYTTGVASWKYGLGAIIALCHDILIVTGFFSIFGHFKGIEVDILFVTALLTILGYSVNDTIVVYDRTRENLHKYSHQDFETTVNQSINQTIVRSINTSLTVFLILLAIFFFGGTSIKHFVLALILGVFLGSYSSIFIASALLVVWQKDFKKK
jgi:preprotein translocase subunit SecF